MIYISFKNNQTLDTDLHQQIFDTIDNSILMSSDSTAFIEYRHNPIGYLESIINRVDKLFCLPFPDGEISYYSQQEIMLAMDNNIECYYVTSVSPFNYELITDIENYTVLDLEQTKIRISQELS